MNKDELLYRYFSNGLSDAQLEYFESLLETDLDFKKQFEFEKNLKRIVKAKQQVNLRKKLNDYESRIRSEETKKPSSYMFLKIAASFLILVTAGWFAYQNFSYPDYERLYLENFETYPNTVYSITRDNADDSIERQAFLAYESGDFATALEKFQQLQNPEYIDFYLAQTYLKLEDISKAKKNFSKVVKANVKFIAESKWYLALIAIKESQKKVAITYLEDLIENHDYKREAATALLEKLD